MRLLGMLRTPSDVLWHMYVWRNESSLGAEGLKELQEKKLQKVLDAASKVPFYTKLGKLPSASEMLENPQLIPMTLKQDLRDRPESFLKTGTDLSRLSYHQTSGSTGLPTRIYMDRKTAAYRVAVMLSCDIGFGRRPFELYGRVHGFGFEESYILKRLGIFPKLFLSVLDPPEKNFALLREKRPRMLRGYPSAIYLLARMNEKSERPLKLKCVVSVAELITDEMKRTIGESFACPVYNHYGSMEASSIARTCKNGKLHVDSHACLVEIVDKDGKPACRGEIAVTPLFNTTMPILRFRLGDEGTWGKCGCGRETLVIENLAGRMDDYIILPSGKRQPGKNFHLRYEELAHFYEYQVCQEEPGLITIYYVPSGKGLPEDAKRLILERLKIQCLGEKVEIRFQRVDAVGKGRTGKLRTVLSKVRL